MVALWRRFIRQQPFKVVVLYTFDCKLQVFLQIKNPDNDSIISLYLNNLSWFKPLGNIVSKWWIQNSSRLSWPIRLHWSIIWTDISLWVPLQFGQEKYYINFSCLNPLCPSPYNLIFDLYWVKAAKFCDSGPNILLSESFTGRLKNHAYTVAI